MYRGLRLEDHCQDRFWLGEFSTMLAYIFRLFHHVNYRNKTTKMVHL